MDENVTVVFHGFLNLNGRQKLALVGAINDYFDSDERDPIREKNEADFARIDLSTAEKACKCCGR